MEIMNNFTESRKYLDNKDFIYKYTPVNVNLFKLLINNELWSAIPSTLNDPLDCSLNNISVIQPVDKESLTYFYKEAFTSIPKYKNYDIDSLLAEATKSQEVISKHYKEFFEYSSDRFLGITSFSKKFDNIAMWSHYAQGNRV